LELNRKETGFYCTQLLTAQYKLDLTRMRFLLLFCDCKRLSFFFLLEFFAFSYEFTDTRTTFSTAFFAGFLNRHFSSI